MFSNAKVGDRVWCLRSGWGIVTTVDREDSRYQLYVVFEDGQADWFTNCGREMTHDLNPILFWDEVKITPPTQPLPKLEVDTPILVRDRDDERWLPAHFARFSPEGVVTWMGGKTSYTAKDGDVMFWEQWKLPESENNK